MRPIAATLLLAVAGASCAVPVTASTAPSPSAAASSADDLAEQKHEAGAVGISAAWIGATAAVRVVMDTHSVDLDGFDLRELARLRLDGGDWLSPTRWDAPKGGHHRSGTLAFDSVDGRAFAAARVIELEIRDVGVPSHLLRWERAR